MCIELALELGAASSARLGLAETTSAVSGGGLRDQDGAQYIAQAVLALRTVLQHWPTEATCLQQATALSAVLSRRGVSTEVRLGTRRAADGTLAAHAWLEHGGQVVFDAGEPREGYRAMAQRFTSVGRA